MIVEWEKDDAVGILRFVGVDVGELLKQLTGLRRFQSGCAPDYGKGVEQVQFREESLKVSKHFSVLPNHLC